MNCPSGENYQRIINGFPHIMAQTSFDARHCPLGSHIQKPKLMWARKTISKPPRIGKYKLKTPIWLIDDNFRTKCLIGTLHMVKMCIFKNSYRRLTAIFYSMKVRWFTGGCINSRQWIQSQFIMRLNCHNVRNHISKFEMAVDRHI